MQVKFLVPYEGPTVSHKPGEEKEIDDAEALRLERAGHVRILDRRSAKPEKATKGAGEKAVDVE